MLYIWKVLGTNFLCIEHLNFQVSFFPGWYLKHSRAVTTELNKLWERADNIKTKVLTNRVHWKKTIGMDTELKLIGRTLLIILAACHGSDFQEKYL